MKNWYWPIVTNSLFTGRTWTRNFPQYCTGLVWLYFFLLFSPPVNLSHWPEIYHDNIEIYFVIEYLKLPARLKFTCQWRKWEKKTIEHFSFLISYFFLSSIHPLLCHCVCVFFVELVFDWLNPITTQTIQFNFFPSKVTWTELNWQIDIIAGVCWLKAWFGFFGLFQLFIRLSTEHDFFFSVIGLRLRLVLAWFRHFLVLIWRKKKHQRTTNHQPEKKTELTKTEAR